MRSPAGNFSSIGLARLFGADPAYEPRTPPPTYEPRTPPHAAHSETAIIVGAVCGVAGLALVVALGGYAASWWRKSRIHPGYEQSLHKILERDIDGNVRGGAVGGVELPTQSASGRSIPELGTSPVCATQRLVF